MGDLSWPSVVSCRESGVKYFFLIAVVGYLEGTGGWPQPAGAVGRFYFCSDTIIILYSNHYVITDISLCEDALCF